MDICRPNIPQIEFFLELWLKKYRKPTNQQSKMSKFVLKNLNEFVIQMIKSYEVTIESDWMSEETQNKLKEILEMKKPKADPSRPKRAKSSYLFFCEDARADLKKENPEIKAKEVMSKLGEMWTKLKESTITKDKKKVVKYENKATNDKERFSKEMDDYAPTEGYEKVEKKKKGKTGPVGPKTSYMLFSKDARASLKKENPKITALEIREELKSQWVNLKENDSEKFQKYKELAEEDKARYIAEMNEAGLEIKKRSKKAPGGKKAKKIDNESDKESEKSDMESDMESDMSDIEESTPIISKSKRRLPKVISK